LAAKSLLVKAKQHKRFSCATSKQTNNN